jgi:hypothetical protein
LPSTGSGRPKPRKSDHILLVDRCLTPLLAREISKIDGLYGISLAEQFGDEAAQSMPDVDFLAIAGAEQWGVLTQNPRMWRVTTERERILEHSTRVFSLDDASSSLILKGLVFGRHILSVRRRMERPGACFWRLRLQDIRRDLG